MADVSQIKLPNGSVYDLIDEKSGYITAEYIENKTDYEIPVSRVGEIVVGETAIGTDSTNFPTSKAVVDYVDERVVQEIEAISVPTKTSDLTNDSGYIIANSPVLIGTPTAPTPTNTAEDAQIATVKYVQDSIDNTINNYEIIVDPISQVGTAQTGIATTDESNYKPKGNIIFTNISKLLVTSVDLDYSYNNYILSINGINISGENINIPTKAIFEGADTKLIITQRSD